MSTLLGCGDIRRFAPMGKGWVGWAAPSSAAGLLASAWIEKALTR
jgi:hypothetical protein